MAYAVRWSTGSVEGAVEDEHGEPRRFDDVAAANAAARAEFAAMADRDASGSVRRREATGADGAVSITDASDPDGFAVWAEAA
jgi:hypothetical protein